MFFAPLDLTIIQNISLLLRKINVKLFLQIGNLRAFQCAYQMIDISNAQHLCEQVFLYILYLSCFLTSFLKILSSVQGQPFFHQQNVLCCYQRDIYLFFHCIDALCALPRLAQYGVVFHFTLFWYGLAQNVKGSKYF